MPHDDFDHVIATLGLDAQKEAWRAWWPAPRTDATADAWLFSPGRLEGLCDWLAIPRPAAAALRQALDDTLQQPERRRLLAQATRMLAMAQVQPGPMPQPDPELGPWAALFQALAVLGSVPETQRRHQLRGIDDAVTRDTFNDVARWMLDGFDATGRWTYRSVNWVFNHVSGRLFELGRLQFGRSFSDLPFHVFTGVGAEAGRVIALAADGLRVRADGQFLTADRGRRRHEAHLVTRFETRDSETLGHAVLPDGTIAPTPTRLPRTLWQCRMEPGSPVLDVHIPSRAPLDPAAVADSFRRAAEFFPRFFPEHAFAGYTCTSWLMDPQLALRLPPDCNTVQFLRLFHNVPCPSGSDFQTFERVFGGYVDPATAPRKTSMQKAVLAHVDAGRVWRHASGFRLREEVR